MKMTGELTAQAAVISWTVFQRCEPRAGLWQGGAATTYYSSSCEQKQRAFALSLMLSS